MNCRKRRDDIKTRGVSLIWDKSIRNLFPGGMVSVMHPCNTLFVSFHGSLALGLRLNNGSRMSCEVHVRFCEGLAGRFRRSTLLVITVSGHYTKCGWAEHALKRLCEQIEPLGLRLNTEKTKIVDTLTGVHLDSLSLTSDAFQSVKEVDTSYYFPRRKRSALPLRQRSERLSAMGVQRLPRT